MVSKERIINLYNKGYSIDYISEELFRSNRYISNMLNIKDAQKVVESVLLDYTTHVPL